MITFYKNINESSWSKYVLCISYPENIHQQIHEWQANLDKIVFDEQIKTGSFHGQFPIDNNRRARMQELLEKGIIRPYYGAINARAFAYTLHIISPKCVIGVEHEVLNEKAFFEDTVSILQKDASVMNDDFRKEFVIEEQEYRTLQKWENWDERDEFTSRYIYMFFPTSIGLVIKVTDTHTKDQIDISDYENW
jgi:hypothetical protein